MLSLLTRKFYSRRQTRSTDYLGPSAKPSCVNGLIVRQNTSKRKLNKGNLRVLRMSNKMIRFAWPDIEAWLASKAV